MSSNPFLAIGSRFQDSSVVDRYHLRLPYPTETFDLLLAWIADSPQAMLDVGTGPGVLARQLVERVERVDAVDPSAAMLERGKALPNGNHPRLRWLHGRIEDVLLTPPVEPWSHEDTLELQAVATIVWGKPLRPDQKRSPETLASPGR